MEQKRLKAARLAIMTATTLAIVKLGTGILTGSMALLSSAADSLLDILMSLGNFFALKQAHKPADDTHPYGHGKYETAATFLQSVLVGISGGYILYESIHRLTRGVTLKHVDYGIGVLALSVLVSWLLSRYLKQVGQQTESSALQADALHYATDVYSNLVLLIGLVVVNTLGWSWLDPVLSLGVGIYVLKAAYGLFRSCLDEFLDAGLPPEQLKKVSHCIEQHRTDVTGHHHLRSRRSGTKRLIDFHLTFCRFKTIQEAHAIADSIEKEIRRQIPNADITIHLEPTECEQCRNCTTCQAPCEAKEHRPARSESNDPA
nr:cation diffusion facilitator family transporter [uncultured Desulfuromonas sp.]